MSLTPPHRISLSASPEPLPAAARWGLGALVLAVQAAAAWALLRHLPVQVNQAASPDQAIVVDMIATATESSPREQQSSPAPAQLRAPPVRHVDVRPSSHRTVAAPPKPSPHTSQRSEIPASASPPSVAQAAPADATEPSTQPNESASAAHTPTAAPPAPSPAPPASNAPPVVGTAPLPPTPKALAISAVEYLAPPQLEYPLAARRMREQGEARVRVLVDVQGLPQQLQLVLSSGSTRLDEAALQAARRARFKPYTENGTALPFWVVMPLVFELEK